MPTKEELRSFIETAYLNDPRLSSHAIAVSVSDGKVTLEGSVQSFRRKLLAQRAFGNGSFSSLDDIQALVIL